MSFKEKFKDIINKTSAYLQTKSLKSIIWSFVGCVAPFVILTTSVVVFRIGNFLPNETDVFFLVPKEPEFEVSDGKTVWENDTEIEVFKSEYVNGENKITVLSSDGEGIVAPGTENSYTFKLKNNGNIAVDYKINTKFALNINGEEEALEDFPLLVKLKKEGGDYLIGGEDKWIPVHEAASKDASGTLGVNSYDAYTIEIKWIFDGDDTVDTGWGSLAATESVIFSLDIDSYASENEDPGATGGLHSPDGSVEKIGGRIEVVPFTLLITLMVLEGAAFTCTLLLKNKKPDAPTTPTEPTEPTEPNETEE